MNAMSDDRPPLEEAIELMVYAPLGFALEARSLLPRFVDRGRNQVAMARVIGKFAVRKGSEDVEAAVVNGQRQIVGLLQLLGVVDGDERPTTGPSTPADRQPVAVDRPAPLRAVRTDPGIEPTELAIPDYDSLSASQVVPRLASLEASELDVVRRYEEGTRGRRTILAKIAALQQTA
jgi:hypothetical protein